MKAKNGLWVAASAVLHVVVVLLLLQAMLAPRGFISLFRANREPIRVQELTYVVPVTPELTPRVPGIAAPPRIQPVPVAPPNIPTTVPVIPKGPPTSVPVDSGPTRTIAGPPSGDPVLPTLNPGRPDPRIMGNSVPPLPEPPKRTGLAAIEYSLDSALNFKRDSIAKLRNPSDWTVGEGKGKFGMDERWIYIAGLKIPTMLLGLIPMKGVQGNPGAYDRSKTLGAMAAEVRERGATAQSQRHEINSINARAQREYAKRHPTASTSGGKVPPE